MSNPRQELVQGCFERVQFLEKALSDDGGPIDAVWCQLYKRIVECNWLWSDRQEQELNEELSRLAGLDQS